MKIPSASLFDGMFLGFSSWFVMPPHSQQLCSLSSHAKSKNDANKATHYVNLKKKMREISRRNYRIISSRWIIKAITIILAMWAKFNDTDAELWLILYAFKKVET